MNSFSKAVNFLLALVLMTLAFVYAGTTWKSASAQSRGSAFIALLTGVFLLYFVCRSLRDYGYPIALKVYKIALALGLIALILFSALK